MSIEVYDFAFPCTVYDASLEMMIAYPGATLRDYFAIKALPAVIVSCHNLTIDDDTDKAYEYADSMLVSRAKAQTAQGK